jgi:hypothetical protein
VNIKVEIFDPEEMADVPIFSRDIALDDYTSRMLAENVNTKSAPTVRLSLVMEERLTTVIVAPGRRPNG